MHNWPLKSLTIVCGVVFASGCAPIKNISTALSALTTAPVSRVTHGTESSNNTDGIASEDTAKYEAAIAAYRKSLQEHATSSEANYRTGRSHQDRLQYDAAIAAYRKALQLNPGNAEAHNALGVVFASQGKHQQAIKELIAAAALAPKAAHIHNNLGYAYVLQGRDAEAMSALTVATGLDTSNERARQNMKTAAQRLSQDAHVAASAGSLSTVDGDKKLPSADTDLNPSAPRLLVVAPNVYELRQAASALPHKVTGPLSGPGAYANVNVEITNGNGVNGLAKRTSAYLRRQGYAITRLTNQQPYTQPYTEIQYRRGSEAQAKRLNALLSAPAKLVESKRLSAVVSVRLVLGRDVSDQSLHTEAVIGDVVGRS